MTLAIPARQRETELSPGAAAIARIHAIVWGAKAVLAAIKRRRRFTEDDIARVAIAVILVALGAIIFMAAGAVLTMG